MPTILDPKTVTKTVEATYPVVGAEEHERSLRIRFLPDLVRLCWRDGELVNAMISGHRVLKRKGYSGRESETYYPADLDDGRVYYGHKTPPPQWLVEFVRQAVCP